MEYMNGKLAITLIKKIAQELEDMPGTPAPAPSGDDLGEMGAPVPTTPSSGSYASPVVKSMQAQLQGLAQDVMSWVNMSDMSKQQTDATHTSGRVGFSDFITKNYLSHSDVPGVEFDSDPTKTQMSQKSPTDPRHLNVVMDTMQRIGNPQSGEFQIDGKWGPRTNAALRNAYAYAFALLKLSVDFHFRPTFTEQDLNQLKEMIPLDYKETSPTKKIEDAPKITNLLKNVREMFYQVKQHVLEKPANQAYIEGDQPVHTYKAPPTIKLDPQTLQSMSQQFDSRLRVSLKDTEGKDIAIPIAVSDLVSKQALQAWQQKNAPQTPLPVILNSLESAVSLIEGSVTPEGPPQQAQPNAPQG